MSRLHILIPVYNDVEALNKLLDGIARSVADAVDVLVVDDGSLDQPVADRSLRDRPLDVELIRLRRNVGHQRAIAVGLCHLVRKRSEGVFLVMDGDGEDRPEDIPRLVAALADEGVDAVVAERRKRRESRLFRGFYEIYKGLFRLLTGKVIRFGNFCAMTPEAARRLVYMDELWMHVPATLLKSGLRLHYLPVDRGSRYCGRSRMNLVSLVTHGLRSVAIFTEAVLTRIILFCAMVAGSSLALILTAFAIKLLGFATPGWFTVAVGALLGLLVQTATITLISLLIAMNSRHSAAQIPFLFAVEYIESVESLGATSGAVGGPA